jgi:hypothetical protein
MGSMALEGKNGVWLSKGQVERHGIFGMMMNIF